MTWPQTFGAWLKAPWRSIRTAGSAFPAPVPGDEEAMAAAGADLESLLDRDPARFDACFLRGRPLRVRRAERALFEHLLPLGTVVHLGPGLYGPCVRLVRLDGRWIASDLLRRDSEDQVFTLMFEQVYMTRNMGIRPGETVLELCAGAGALSLFAADTAGALTAVDINPRALAFARFNLALNACAKPVELCEGSLYEPLEVSRRFDHILVNPPFEPMPPGTTAPLHSAGGEDGLDVVRAVLDGASQHLAPAGRLTMITWSPGTEDGPLLTELARAALPAHDLHVNRLETSDLAPTLERHEDASGYAAWRARLASRHLTHLDFVFLHAEPSDAPGVEIRRPEAEVATCHDIADAWR